MNDRIKRLRDLEPHNSGRVSYLAILEAAAGLFRQFPAKDIALRDILAISGVSNQTLYNYFPGGRDDIALALFDRFQRTMVDDYNRAIRSANFESLEHNEAIIAYISACLARVVFGFLTESYVLQLNLVEYLRSHKLLLTASHKGELEEALARDLALCFGSRLQNGELLRTVRLSVHTTRGLADLALLHPDFAPDFAPGELESYARKLLRVVLTTGLQGQEAPSGSHELPPFARDAAAILGATISQAKKQGILDRILKRQRLSKPRD